METYRFNKNALRRFCEGLKDAVDRKGIISSHRGGFQPCSIWKGVMKALAVSVGSALAMFGMASMATEKREDPVAVGKQVFDRHCVACHGAGVGFPPFAELPGTEALRVRYKGAVPALLTERTDLTPELVAYFVRNGVSVMAPYRKTEISDAQLAALGKYLSRNNPSLAPKRGN